jgi:hypothetical protein
MVIALAMLPVCSAQTDAKDASGKPPKRLYFGLRVRNLPVKSFSVMNGRSLRTTTPAVTGTPARDWSFVTASHSRKWGLGGGLEYLVSPKIRVTAEAMQNRLSYTKVTDGASGSDDPTTGSDERTHIFVTEDSRGKLWDFPVLAHYRGFSKFYFSGGMALRIATSLRSSTTINYADGTTATNTFVTVPSRRNLLGAVAGFGMRFTDDFHLNWIPEIRYTRWMGSTFAQQSTISPRNQLEISLGVTF